FISRASLPSIPSRKAANSTIVTAVSKRPSKAKRMHERPTQMESTVTRLGSTMRSGIPRKRVPPVPWGGKGLFTTQPILVDPHERRCRGAAELGEDRLPGDRGLADRNAQRRVPRHEHVDAGAEADEAEALADRDVAAGLCPADDAPRDEARHLHRRHRSV